MKTKRIIHTPKKVLPGLLLSVFLDAFTTSLFIPAIAIGAAESYSADIVGIAELKLYGIATIIYLIAQCIATPLVGQMSDRFGRKIALLWSLIGAVIGNMIFFAGIVSGTVWMLLAGKLLDGVSGGTQAIVRSVIADVAHNATRVQYFGLLGGIYSIGAVLGALLGVRSVQLLDHATPAFTSIYGLGLVLSLCNALIVLIVVPETYRLAKRWHVSWSGTVAFILNASRAQSHRILFLTTLLFMSGASMLFAFIPYYLQERSAFSFEASQELLWFMLVVSAVAQAIIAPILARLFRAHAVVKGSLFASCIVILLVFKIGGSGFSPVLFGALFAVPYGITVAHITALVSGTSSKLLQGEILGIDVAMHAAAQLVPAVLLLVANPAVLSRFIYVAVGAVFLAALLFAARYRTPAYALKVNNM